jgi:hypothetical protein
MKAMEDMKSSWKDHRKVVSWEAPSFMDVMSFMVNARDLTQ